MKKSIKILLIISLTLGGIGLMAISSKQVEAIVLTEGEGAVCEGYDIKVDVPNDGSTVTYDGEEAYISVNPNLATWEAKEGWEITAVCVKIGGPGGGSLITFGPGDGSYTKDKYGISHIAIDVEPTEPTTETPEPTTETPEPTTETPEPTTETPEPTTETPQPTETEETSEPSETSEPTEPPIQPDPDLGVGDWMPFIGAGLAILAIGVFLGYTQAKGKLPLKKFF